MVQYADIPERQRWIFGYYLILCLAGFSMVLGSPGPAIPIVLGDTMSGDTAVLLRQGWEEEALETVGTVQIAIQPR
jgi:hypothetical protein